MKAIIKLDVPEWQIGQKVSVYFPDTMIKRSICELSEQPEVVRCEDCKRGKKTNYNPNKTEKALHT